MNPLFFYIGIERFLWVIPVIFAMAALRYFIVAGLAYLMCYRWGSTPLKQFKIQQRSPQQKQVLYEMAWSLSTIFIFGVYGVIIYVLYINGYTTIYMGSGQPGWFYLIGSLLVMFVIHDAYFYWTHRLLHTPWFLKHVHAVHHRSTNPTPLAAYCFHPLEGMLQGAILFPFVLIFPVSSYAVFLFTFFIMLANVIGHLGFEFFPKKLRNSWPGRYFIFSTHHNIHHHRCNKNFGHYFTFWDKKMRTLQQENNLKTICGKGGDRTNCKRKESCKLRIAAVSSLHTR